MPRKRKQQIEVNSNESLQGLLQEVYNDACNQINDAQRVVNEVAAGSDPEDVDDWAKVAKAKTDALKLKDSGIKAKLDVAKLQAELIKHNGNLSETVKANPDVVSVDSFAKIREMIKDKGEAKE
jgi:hypothetical protein